MDPYTNISLACPTFPNDEKNPPILYMAINVGGKKLMILVLPDRIHEICNLTVKED